MRARRDRVADVVGLVVVVEGDGRARRGRRRRPGTGCRSPAYEPKSMCRPRSRPIVVDHRRRVRRRPARPSMRTFQTLLAGKTGQAGAPGALGRWRTDRGRRSSRWACAPAGASGDRPQAPARRRRSRTRAAAASDPPGDRPRRGRGRVREGLAADAGPIRAPASTPRSATVAGRERGERRRRDVGMSRSVPVIAVRWRGVHRSGVGQTLVRFRDAPLRSGRRATVWRTARNHDE